MAERALRDAHSDSRVKSHLNILLVEDHHDTAAALMRLLCNIGYTVRMAASLGSARKLAGEQPFDVMVCDIGLPDGDGCDLFRELQMTDKPIRGIALSGYGMPEDVARTRAAGFEVHLLKPVSFARLVEQLEQPSS